MKKKPSKTEKSNPDSFDSNYQPKKRDKQQELDMPGADMKTLQKAFFSGSAKKK